MPFKDFTTEPLTSADVDLYLMSQTIIRCTSSTRPASPAAGWRIWETDTNREMLYNGSSWVFYRGLDYFVRKSADQTVTSSTTIQTDSHLTFTFDASAVFIINILLRYASPAAADFRLTPTVVSGTATFVWTGGGPHHTSSSTLDSATLSVNSLGSVADYMGFDVNATARPTGLLRTTTSGVFTLRWQQVVASGTTTVATDSYMHAIRVA